MGEFLIDKLPSFYDNGMVVPEIQKSLDIEKDVLLKETIDLTNQLFVETATWGLSLWEEFLNIPNDETLGYELRRSRIKSKITRSTPALTQNQLVNILKPYFDSVNINEFARENRFEVIFGTNSIIGNNLSIAIKEIEESKPAHLDYMAGINYITRMIISQMFKRWDSEVLPLCGTIVCSSENNEEYITTLGRKYSDSLSGTNDSYISDRFTYTSESEYIEGYGKVYVENICQVGLNLFSEKIKIASVDTFAEEVKS